MKNEPESINAIREIISGSLMSPIDERAKKVRDNGIDFAHYTKAETAFNIIKSRSFWLRNSQLMNDHTEMRLGLYAVELNFTNTKGPALPFWAEMKLVDPYFQDKVVVSFNNKKHDLLDKTYIGCLSEYSATPRGVDSGKLSMWRAYGYPNGVALIFDGASILSGRSTLDVTSYPVFYPEYGVDLHALGQGIANLAKNAIELKKYDPQEVADVLADIMIHLAIGIKDTNFNEEAEWRVVFREGVYENNVSTVVPTVVSGVPQLVCSVPLDDDRPLSLKKILKKVIIGPTEYPDLAREAFVKLLHDEGFDDAALKVFTSNIPYRG